MEELLMELARTARNECAVASRQLNSGLELLVYPCEDGMIVGLGLERESAEQMQMEDVLRKRCERLERFGAWQPALFTDGSFYVVRRVPGANPDSSTPILSEDDLAAAEELLT